VGGLVETVKRFEFTDQIRINAAGTAVAGVGFTAPQIGSDDLGAAASRDAVGSTGLVPLHTRDYLLHGASRSGLNDDEVEHHDAEQRRDHQQQAPQDVTRHGVLAIAGTDHHVSRKPREINGTISGRPNLLQ